MTTDNFTTAVTWICMESDFSHLGGNTRSKLRKYNISNTMLSVRCDQNILFWCGNLSRESLYWLVPIASNSLGLVSYFSLWQLGKLVSGG